MNASPKSLVVFILSLLIPAVVGLVQIYEWFSGGAADVQVYYTHEAPLDFLPRPIARFTGAFWMLRDAPLENRRKIEELLLQEFDREAQSKGLSGEARARFRGALGLVTTGSKMLDATTNNRLLILNISNEGEIPAQNMMITLSQPGYYELWQAGSFSEPKDSGETNGEIRIPELHAGTMLALYFFSNSASGDIPTFKVSYPGGKADIARTNIRRTPDRWVFQFEKRDLKLWASAGAVFLCSLAMINASWLVHRFSKKPHQEAIAPTTSATPKDQ